MCLLVYITTLMLARKADMIRVAAACGTPSYQ